jgi:hypothetical protein
MEAFKPLNLYIYYRALKSITRKALNTKVTTFYHGHSGQPKSKRYFFEIFLENFYFNPNTLYMVHNQMKLMLILIILNLECIQ